MARLKREAPKEEAIPTQAQRTAVLWAEAKARVAEASDQLKLLTKELLAQLEDAPGGEVELPDHRTFRRVQATRSSTDYEAIHLLLDEAQRKLVCVEKIDPKKFSSAVELGAIDMDLVVEHTTETKAAPFIREGKKRL